MCPAFAMSCATCSRCRPRTSARRLSCCWCGGALDQRMRITWLVRSTLTSCTPPTSRGATVVPPPMEAGSARLKQPGVTEAQAERAVSYRFAGSGNPRAELSEHVASTTSRSRGRRSSTCSPSAMQGRVGARRWDRGVRGVRTLRLAGDRDAGARLPRHRRDHAAHAGATAGSPCAYCGSGFPKRVIAASSCSAIRRRSSDGPFLGFLPPGLRRAPAPVGATAP